MNDPIQKKIRANLVAQLAKIRRANGYQLDVEAEQENEQGGIAGEYKVFVLDGMNKDISSEQNATPHGHDGFQKTFNLAMVIAKSSTNSTPINDLFDVFEADVRKILTTGRNYTLGGLVRNYDFEDSHPTAIPGISLPTRNLPFTVHYLTLRGNPYEQ